MLKPQNDAYVEQHHQDSWEKLKQFTDARIALGRTGCSIPTHAMLEFQLAHAQARDAVYHELNVENFQKDLTRLNLKSLVVHSQAKDKEEYLKRPDFGRLLNQNSIEQIDAFKQQHSESYDVCICVGDGLSAFAIEQNALLMIEALKSEFDQLGWKLAPVIIGLGSRVALGDQVAERFSTPMLVMMIGERPGLSSPDSLGIYYTLDAHTGSLDSQRNCISNIRPAGLSVQIATQRLIHLMKSSKSLGYSGVNLKDDHEIETITQNQNPKTLF